MTSLLDAPAASAGELRGEQTPRLFYAPEFTSSAGQEVCELAEMAGLVLDPWQRFVLHHSLGERPDGKWAAFEVFLKVSRQNGKGAVLEARELGGLFLLGEELILHSAHEFKTSQEAFRRVLGLIQNTPELDRRISRIRTSHGEEGIELTTGQRLRFVARSRGSGRGFSCDCLIYDECMILTDEVVGASMPTMSARPNPQVWYTGSAGDLSSTVMGRLRARGLAAIAARDAAAAS